MWRSNADRWPPGTVTTRRRPGPASGSPTRSNASGSSTCSSTSEHMACVAQPARPSPGSWSLSRSTCSNRPSGTLRRRSRRPWRSARSRRARPPASASAHGEGQVALAAADVEVALRLARRAEQAQRDAAPERLGGVVAAVVSSEVSQCVSQSSWSTAAEGVSLTACSRRPPRRGGTSARCRARTRRGPCRSRPSFFSRSWVTVMMWQPIASAWTTLSTSRGLAQISSTPGCGRSASSASRHDRHRVAAGVGDAAGEHGDEARRGRRRAPRRSPATCSTRQQRR